MRNVLERMTWYRYFSLSAMFALLAWTISCSPTAPRIKPLQPLPPIGNETAEQAYPQHAEVGAASAPASSPHLEEETIEPESAQSTPAPAEPSSAAAQVSTDLSDLSESKSAPEGSETNAGRSEESEGLSAENTKQPVENPSIESSNVTTSPSEEQQQASQADTQPSPSSGDVNSQAGANQSQTGTEQTGNTAAVSEPGELAALSPNVNNSTSELTRSQLLAGILDFKANEQLSNHSLNNLITPSLPAARAASMRMVEQARENLKNNDTTSALQALSQAISIDPSNPYAYFYMGRAYLAKKEPKQALAFLRRAELGFASDPLWLGETKAFEGCAEELLGNIEKAEEAYQKALTDAPNNYLAQLGYSRLSSQVTKPDISSGDAASPSPNDERVNSP